MQVAKSITVKVSPRINRNKFLQLREFYNTYQAIARYYSSYILEHNLHKALVNDMTAKDLKQILQCNGREECNCFKSWREGKQQQAEI